jgi:hypothetical protein
MVESPTKGEGTLTMTHEPDDVVDVLRTVWAADARAEGPTRADLEEACGPTKSCKNMQLVGFDGLAEPGTDLRQAWHDKLEREGKLSTSGSSIRDLVLGSGEAR